MQYSDINVNPKAYRYNYFIIMTIDICTYIYLRVKNSLFGNRRWLNISYTLGELSGTETSYICTLRGCLTVNAFS